MVSFLKENKCAERGSIMLEVIAVLALMGVMGAMLFRQIYQRNQELHNIQMASEMRTIKEAFSAYIQASRANIFHDCTDEGICTALPSATLGPLVRDYLPDGWFYQGGHSTLQNFYEFSVVRYNTPKPTLYGVVAPLDDNLPQSDWNLKRAARVALLIGADGGIYNPLGDSLMHGSLGTWDLSWIPTFTARPRATYVAITSLDVFTPEYELPEGKVDLKSDWQLATKKLGAWSYFSAGGTVGAGGCYVVAHTGATGGTVDDDTFNELSNTCQPLFVVDQTAGGDTGQVFVNHDLEVGTIDASGTHQNITVTQEGLVKQEDGLVIDKQGRIVSRTIDDGDKGNNAGLFMNAERYVLDPAYTSNMNDIRLASRGGARLSDILPNYILKTQQAINGSAVISPPTCPTGYKAALVVLPVSWDQDLKKRKDTGALEDIASDSFPVSITSGSIPVSTGTIDKNAVKIDIKGNLDNDNASAKSDITVSGQTATASSTHPLTGTADLTRLNLTEGVCVKITTAGTTMLGGRDEPAAANPTASWNVVLGYKNTESNCTAEASVRAIAQTYCVFDATTAGATFTGKLPAKDNKTQCEAAGFTWNATDCRYVYKSCATIESGFNNGTEISDKAAVCKANRACVWDGTHCNSVGP